MSKASLELGGDNWAAKDGNLLGYAQGTSSSKFVPREFTFTRGSNLAATRVAANGLIEKGRENLLLQSNQFDTTWVSVTASVTSGQSGYDGSNDAWLLSKSAASGRIYQNASVSGVATYSVYAKSNDLDWLFIIGTPSSYPEAYFNLSNGTIGNTSNHQNFIGANIEDVGNGWYRCSITFNDSLGQFRIYPADGNNDFSGTSGSIYIQDAQLEQGLVATDYIETGASTVQAGLLEDEPRIDYTGGTGSLLLEPSRTNLFTQSEYYGSGGWSINNGTLTTNYAVSPEGVQNASKINFSAGGEMVRTTEFTAGQAYTFSFYAKVESGTFDFTYGNIDYILISGTATTEWQRFEVTQTAPVVTRYPKIDATDTGDLLIWGCQIEEGSYPTSYIPNHSGGSVTRSRDLADNQSLESVLGDGDLTILYDFNYDVVGRESFGQLFLTFSGADSLGIKGTQTTNRSLQIFSNGGFANNITFNNSSPYATSHKVLLRITSDVVELFYNGTKHNDTINTDGIVGSYSWDRIKIDATDAFSAELNQILTFPTALSDAQCSALTVEGLKEEILTSYIAAVDTLEDGAEARLDTYLQNLEELIV